MKLSMNMKYFGLALGLLLVAFHLKAQEVVQVEAKARVVNKVFERGFLGIYSGEMNADKARLLNFDTEYGSYITRVIPNSGAARAGLQPFDYLVGVNDDRVSRNRDITDLLDPFEPGDAVTVHFIRQGKNRNLKVTLGYRSSASYSEIPEADQPFFGISPHDDNNDDELGVRVDVINNSTAESLGLQNGDVILSINGFPMIDWSDIGAAIDNLIPGHSIRVEFARNGDRNEVTGSIRSRRETDRAIEEARMREPAFIGIYSEQLPREKAEKLGLDNRFGSFVSGIIPGTAAAEYGIEPFDLIYGVDEYRTGEYQNLGHILRKYKSGDEATLHIMRKGERITLPFRFGSRDDRATTVSSSPCSEPFLGVRHSFETNDMEGVGITVVPNSTAAALGLEDGDIITHINGYRILDWSDIGTAIDNLTVGEPIEVRYRRDGSNFDGEQPIKSECETRQTETEYNFDDESWPSGRERAPRRALPANLNIDIENLAESDAREFRDNHEVNLPTSHNLRVEGLSLFPEEGSHRYILQFNLPSQGETSVQIYNASGRLIYNYDLGSFSGQFSDPVDISQNGVSTYYIVVRQGPRSVSKKAVLSRG